MLIDSETLKHAILSIMPERSEVLLIVDNQPEGIVRCKDCRFGEEWGQLVGCGLMAGFGITHKPDWFCADAERKDD